MNRRELDQSYATLERQLAERPASWPKHGGQQTATAEILRVISQSPTEVEPVLRTVTDAAAGLCRADEAAVFLFKDGAYRWAASDRRHGPDTPRCRALHQQAHRDPQDLRRSGRDRHRERAPVHGDPGEASPAFTAFSETSEPEDIMQLLAEYQGALDPLIRTYEGTLDRFTGDGMMVFFNEPLPCPDAPERAARLTLEMRDAVARLGP